MDAHRIDNLKRPVDLPVRTAKSEKAAQVPNHVLETLPADCFTLQRQISVDICGRETLKALSRRQGTNQKAVDRALMLFDCLDREPAHLYQLLPIPIAQLGEWILGRHDDQSAL